MEKENFALTMEKEIQKLQKSGKKPSLLLHSCCAPCSSSVLELLTQYFSVTVFYYNPNIYPQQEFEKRSAEQERFCKEFGQPEPISFVGCAYDEKAFYTAVKGLENEPEGGARCRVCFKLRLEQAAIYAKEHGFDYFTTTLSVSPYKNAQVLNSVGRELSEQYKIKYLYSDFKKKNGYRRSCELSEQYGIYRQDYCGCVYSVAQRLLQTGKAMIFDVDGTLLDTMGFYLTFALNYVKSLGIDLTPNTCKALFSMTNAEGCNYIATHYPIGKSGAQMLADTNKILEEMYFKQAQLKDGVAEFLQFAKQQGYILCVATATDRYLAEAALKRCGVLDLFDCFVTCTEAGASKIKPDVYTICSERIGIAPKQTLVFEDAYHAIFTAKHADYMVVAVREDTSNFQLTEIKEKADLYVNRMTDLIKKENIIANPHE